jgi:polygalacturonase
MPIAPARHLFVFRSAAFAALTAASISVFAAPPPATDNAWKEMDAILKRIAAPTFPAKDFPVVEYGAAGDGTTDCHPAFVKAIEACSKAGGGRVVVPAGTFLCNGPIHLKSNVNLHVSEGATIKFGTNPKDYLPVVLTRWEGTLVNNYSPLIYANGQTNIAVTGKGTLDGSGKAGFAQFTRTQEADRQALWKMGAQIVPVDQRVFGDGHFLRPGGIEPFECTNVLIEGVTVTDMPFWTVHPIFCRNLTIRDIKVDSLTGNNDGCDPDSCKDVLIEGCYFHTGDDSIALKSGRDQDGWTVGRPTENVVIRHCTGAGKLYSFAIGSEISGGVRNVFIEDCKAVSGRAAVYTKANLDRGGTVENVHVRRISVENMTEAVIRFEMNYHGYRGEKHAPTFRNFVIEDIDAKKSNAYAIYAEGQAESPVRDVIIRRVTVDEAKTPLWIRHVAEMRFEDVKVNGEVLPATPPVTPDGEEKLKIRD